MSGNRGRVQTRQERICVKRPGNSKRLEFKQGLIEPPKAAREHVTCVDGEIQDDTKNRFLA